MPTYRAGSKGSEVARIQEQLKSEGFYLGPVDGIFGGGSDAAVRLFQAAKQLTTDGEVGQQTWASLFPDVPIPAPAILDESVQFRCMALTGSFETDQFFPDCFGVFPVILMDRELVSGSYSGTLVRAACSLFCKRSPRRIRTSWSRYLARTMRSSRSAKIRATGVGSFNSKLEACADRALERSVQNPGKATTLPGYSGAVRYTFVQRCHCVMQGLRTAFNSRGSFDVRH